MEMTVEQALDLFDRVDMSKITFSDKLNLTSIDPTAGIHYELNSNNIFLKVGSHEAKSDKELADAIDRWLTGYGYDFTRFDERRFYVYDVVKFVQEFVQQ